MAKEAAPAFQFYVKDWRSSRAVMRMTFAQRGMYLEMLLEQWESGDLPDDPEAVADIIGGTKGEWRRAWPVLRRKFLGSGSGKIRNEKLEEVRSAKQDYHSTQSVNGKKGSDIRWAEKRRDSGAIATPSAGYSAPLAKNSSSSSSSSSVQEHDRARATTTPARLPKGGVMAGSLPRDHRNHAACDDTFSRCVPEAVHSKLMQGLAPKFAGDRTRADAELRRWYPTVWASLPADFVMPDAFRFWQGRFDAVYASADPAAKPKRHEVVNTVPDAEETRRRWLTP